MSTKAEAEAMQKRAQQQLKLADERLVRAEQELTRQTQREVALDQRMVRAELELAHQTQREADVKLREAHKTEADARKMAAKVSKDTAHLHT